MAEEKAKRTGRIRQMVEIYKTTTVHDRNLPWTLLLCFIAPVAVSVLLAWLLSDNWFGWVLWPITGILVGILLVMIVLGRRAEKIAYEQIEGRPGAVGAVVQSALRRSWRGSEVPIAINRNQDAVYRVVGRGGIVLISEGSRQRTQRMAADEERKIRRALRNVEIVHLYVGPDGDGVPLARLSKTLVKLKPKLNRNEVAAVYNRLSSLQAAPVGIPKGMDPNRIRSQRPR
jgi:F0F1-type ATP synthase assembly protein I